MESVHQIHGGSRTGLVQKRRRFVSITTQDHLAALLTGDLPEMGSGIVAVGPQSQ